MQSRVFVLLLLIFSFEAISQKKLQKEFDASSFTSVVVNGHEASLVSVIAEKRETIKINLTIEGEYYESVLLEVLQQNKTLLVAPAFTPFFERHNDKLAAHKVLSVSLEIRVPIDLFVSITSKNSFVEVMGAFGFLYVETDSGAVRLENFIGDGDIKTRSGNIFVKTSKIDVSGVAISQKGIVKNELPEGNRFVIYATSLLGDIQLLETK